MTDRLTGAQWSQYWRNGTITTFHRRFADNYDGPVRDHWHGVLDRLPDGARVVDLATGNGALALIAAQYSYRKQRRFDVVGVDTADIDPAALFAGKGFARHLRSIRFLAQTPLEATSLPDGSQDLAMSQFGFEYADTGPAVAELARILRAEGAIFSAMIHHADSAIIRQAREGLQQVALCEESGLHATLSDLHERLHQLAGQRQNPRQDARANALRDAVNAQLATIKAQGEPFEDPAQVVYYVENSMATFNSTVTKGMAVEQKLAALRHVAAQTQAYQQRMRDLISAALSSDQIAALCARLQAAGFEIEQDEPFEFEGVHFCHLLNARRNRRTG